MTISSTSTSAVSGIGSLSRRQFGTNRVRRKSVHLHGNNTAKQRCSRLIVSATKDLPLPVVLDRDFDKEGSRLYKRTVFTFDNWAAHRSTKRYGRHIYTILGSRIVRGLLQPVLTVMGLASAVATYETLRQMGYLPAFAPGLSIETNAPFSLTSFALSLLLVFKTETSYSRWAEARSIWGGVTNRSRDILRQALTFVPEDKPELVDMFMRWSMAYSKVLMCHLREDGDVEKELKEILPPEELSQLLASQHRPNFVLAALSEMVASTCISSPQRFRMDQNITFFEDCHGKCERILKTPIPLSYTRHTSRFLVIWLGLMPFTLWNSCHWAMVPTSGIICFLLLGIEEIGVQIEEPFGILPLEAMCATIETNLREMTKISGKGSNPMQRFSNEASATNGAASASWRDRAQPAYQDRRQQNGTNARSGVASATRSDRDRPVYQDPKQQNGTSMQPGAASAAQRAERAVFQDRQQQDRQQQVSSNVRPGVASSFQPKTAQPVYQDRRQQDNVSAPPGVAPATIRDKPRFRYQARQQQGSISAQPGVASATGRNTAKPVYQDRQQQGSISAQPDVASPTGRETPKPVYQDRQQLFNRIAPVYDQLNDVLSLGQHRIWKRMAVKWSRASKGQQVLDVCCGSGDLAFRLAEVVGPSGQVVGLDFAQEMLDDAEARQSLQPARRRNANIDWVQGDAMKLPFPDNSFHAATMGYGLRNVPDPLQALKELYRVLKPGSTVAVLDFNNSEDPFVDQFQEFSLQNIVVPAARLYGLAEEYEYLRPSIKRFATGKQQEELARMAGFAKATHYEIGFGLMGTLVASKR
ncbi:hypothetical protein ABBQ38_014948 [Trebouxia sp. C0009 RCD-2024]